MPRLSQLFRKAQRSVSSLRRAAAARVSPGVALLGNNYIGEQVTLDCDPAARIRLKNCHLARGVQIIARGKSGSRANRLLRRLLYARAFSASDPGVGWLSDS